MKFYNMVDYRHMCLSVLQAPIPVNFWLHSILVACRRGKRHYTRAKTGWGTQKRPLMRPPLEGPVGAQSQGTVSLPGW